MDLFANRALARKEALSERIINDRNVLAFSLISFIEISSFQQRNLYCLEITGRDRLRDHRRSLAELATGLALKINRESESCPIPDEGHPVVHRRVGHSRQAQNFIQYLIKEPVYGRHCLIPGVCRKNACSQKMVGIETDRHCLNRLEAANQ